MHKPLTRIGAIGDVHAEDGLLATAIQFLAQGGLDLIVCAGDVVDGKGSVDRCCELLEEHQILTVRGNHDRWFLEGTNRGVEDASRPEQVSDRSRWYLSSLPATREFDTGCSRSKLLVCHGLGDHDLASVRPSDSSEEIFNNLELWALYRHEDLGLVVNGHTHRQEVRTFSHLTVIGVGTLHREQRPCCAIIDILGNRVEFYDLHNGSAIRNSEPVVWNGER